MRPSVVVLLVLGAAVLGGLCGHRLGIRRAVGTAQAPSDFISRSEHELEIAKLRAELDAGRTSTSIAPPVRVREPAPVKLAAGNVDPSTGEAGRLAHPHSMEAMRELFAKLLAGEVEEESSIRDLAHVLARIGSPEAVEMLKQIIESRDLDLSEAGQCLVEGLRHHVDDRVYLAARRILEENLVNGEDSWVGTYGYLELIAHHQSKDSSQFVLDAMEKRSNAQMWHKAIELTHLLDGHIAPGDILKAIYDPHNPSGEQAARAYDGLAAWRDPEADKELVRIAFESGASHAYGAVAKHARPDELDALLAPYSSRESNKENAVVCALFCLRENKSCTPEDRARLGPPILMEVLANQEHAMWRTAAYAVEYDSAYHTPEMAAFLEYELRSSRDKDRARALRDALKDVNKSLRNSAKSR